MMQNRGSKSNFTPTFKLYKPTSTFDPINAEKNGVAFCISMYTGKSGMPHLRLKLARQTGDQNDERMATFGWDQPIVSMKINVWNIGHLLNLLNEKNEKIAFYNETNKGATYVQGSFVNENEFDVKLTFSNPDEAPIDLFFQSNEVAVLKVFVETGLEKILYVNDFS
jgi:hypothetical protein